MGTNRLAGYRYVLGSSIVCCRGAGSCSDRCLGTRIAVVNQPGASGSTGQKSAFDAPEDGYTWAGNADASVATYQVLNYSPENSYCDWQAYFGIYTPCVITVNPSSPNKDWDSLINAFKTRSVNVASAGIGAGGHIAAEAFAGNLGLKYNHVPYGGGNPAEVATVAGETEVVMQLSMEVADMLRAGQLRAIAVLDSKPLKISGVNEIPPVTRFVPTMPSVGFHFGLFIPIAVPGNAAKAISDAFAIASQSEAIKKLAEQRGSVAASIQGLEADVVKEKAATMFGWLMYEAAPDLEGQIRVTKKLGWIYIDARSVDGQNLNDLLEDKFAGVARKLEKEGVQVNCLGSTIANWGADLDTPFEETLAQVDRAIKGMKILGIPMIRIMSNKVYADGEGRALDQREGERFTRLRQICKRFLDVGNPPLTNDFTKPFPYPKQSSLAFYERFRQHIVHAGDGSN
jgi:tripartite-type tricarboxylate transporter receptor subunit TctC